MAGDWIKIQHVTPDKPEIYQMATILGVTPEDAFGRCIRVWIWADQQSLNGHALSVTFVTLDSIARRDGFGAALQKVGWIISNEDGTVSFPRFDRHNGKTAKNRADASNRKKRQRENEGEHVTEMSQEKRDKPVTREEKSKQHSVSTSVDTDGKPSKTQEPSEIIFSYGVSILTSAGATDKQARSFLGGLRKIHSDEAIVDKLRDCLREKPLQPLEWLAAALPPNGSTKQSRHAGFDKIDYRAGVSADGRF